MILLLLLLLPLIHCEAWILPRPRNRLVLHPRGTRTTTDLYSTGGAADRREQIKTLSEEIAERNSVIDNEVKYAVVDGSGLEKLVATAADTTPTKVPSLQQQKASLELHMERMTRPRAYPLFLLEKFTEIAESVLAGVFKLFATIGEEAPVVPIAVEKKKKIVVLGSGWGGVSFLKGIDTEFYDVTVISPRNHFVFTPMLAGASVGTVEYRSICEPIREISKADFLEATATNIDVQNQRVDCESVICEGNSCSIDGFSVDYDTLVITVGAQTNTFGIPGVKEHCNFLKSVQDARRIKSAIVNCFERANLPHTREPQKIHDLTFCVIGAGPTGIEFASELRDFIEQDGPKYYPKLLQYVRIKVIEASPTILAPFDKSLQQEAISRMERHVEIKDPVVRDLLPEKFVLTELLLESSVKEVGQDTIQLIDGRQIPYGLAVWAAGNGPIPLTLSLIESLPEQKEQQSIARGRLAIDPWMRVMGGNGKILAFGDCTCIIQSQLPGTAQVAAQQGEYLAGLLNKKYTMSPELKQGVFPPPVKDKDQPEPLSDRIASFAMNDFEHAKPFQFWNLGILAYTGGGSALAQVSPAPNAPNLKGTGKLGNAVWRSVYLSKQVSWRNRILVLNDWTNRQFFGRDITRV